MFIFQLSGLIKSENIRYICELFYKITGIPNFYVDIDWNIMYEFSDGYTCNPVFSSTDEMLREQLAQCKKIDGCPVFKTTEYLENYFLIDIVVDQFQVGTIVVGPSIHNRIDASMINSIFANNRTITQKQKFDLAHYYHSLPIIEYGKLISISMLLHHIIHNSKLDSATVIEKNAPIPEVYTDVCTTVRTTLLNNRQYNLSHHKLLYEKFLFQCIKQGNKEKLLDHLKRPSGGEAGILSKNPLRNQKNLFICSVALAVRAAIEGGLDTELALTVSDSYIQHVEELNEISEVTGLYLKMLFDLTDRVHGIEETNFSKAVIECRNYIFNHLYENITLEQLSELASLNRNYLSELFKKEVGMSIIEYIQRERIEEAKELLLSTNNSILDICISLSFSDQSYFTKVFKKFTGATPKQYRNK